MVIQEQRQDGTELDRAAPLRLSQGVLNLLASCPRKFQHLYIEQLSAYPLPEQQERLIAGSRFHALVQQWQLGLPVLPLAESDRQLQQWFTDFVAAAPDILGPDILAPERQDANSTTTRQSEHARTLAFEGYLLTVIYDLLILRPDAARILDWKTYPRPQNPQTLRQNWQTRLYLFMLAATSDYAPEQIAMTYWFFQTAPAAPGTAPAAPGTAPDSASRRYQIPYDRRQHEQTRADLRQLLHQLNHWLAAYQTGIAFPQVGRESPECQRCSFAWRCDRATRNGPSASPSAAAAGPPSEPSEFLVPFFPNLADIPEIPL